MTRDARVVVLIIVFGFMGFLLLLTMLLGGFGPDLGGAGAGYPWEKRIARIDVAGDIYESEGVVREIRRWGADRGVRALVVRINSPGGLVASSQEIFEELRRVRDDGKPIVASMGNVAASGAYYVALGTTEIMASPGTLTGSIGVMMTLPNTEELLKKVGLEVQVVKSGSLKDTGSPFRSLSEEEKTILQGVIDDSYGQFVDAVSEMRGMDREKVLSLADGRIYTGRQALQLGLVDTLGTYQDAVRLAADLGGISGEPRIVQQHRPGRLMRQVLGSLWGPGGRTMSIVSGEPRLEYRAAW